MLQLEFDFSTGGRKSTITPEEIEAILNSPWQRQNTKELEERLSSVFTLSPTARTLILD